ncbi:MAG: Holliday junction branch migration protein RuvA [Eubacteriales bacterium]|nr:Holliday junction branch migration protein RuvA [Eubacteriales bacterium]
MIQFIHGILSEISEGYIVVEASGVGYGIFVPATVLPELPPAGEEIRVYTHFSVREDGQTLYGFMNREDREMFRQLLSVNGVGPKGALGILSVLRPDDLRMAIISADAKGISRAPGIGQKTAQRIILDLKDKIDAEAVLAHGGGVRMSDLAAGSADSGTMESGSGPQAEAVEALITLGYSRAEAGRAVRRVSDGETLTTEEILKRALKSL